MSRDAVIVSTARTPIGRAYKGGFNATPGATLGSFSFQAAVERSGIDAAEIDDVVWGSVLNQGTQAGNIGRQVALRGGAPQHLDRGLHLGLQRGRLSRERREKQAPWRIPLARAGGSPHARASVRLGSKPSPPPDVARRGRRLDRRRGARR